MVDEELLFAALWPLLAVASPRRFLLGGLIVEILNEGWRRRLSFVVSFTSSRLSCFDFWSSEDLTDLLSYFR